jgi:LAS seventeen-binding protein 1/2
MNNDWWLGKNLRTGKEGVFPVNYVQVQANHIPPPAPYASPTPQGMYGNEKSQNPYGGYPGQYQPTQQGPPPPGPSNPYNSAVPPMQIAEQPTETKPGKGQEMGKKFGKKLGNAAIFGAGATMGGKIVNSIF